MIVESRSRVGSLFSEMGQNNFLNVFPGKIVKARQIEYIHIPEEYFAVF